LAELQADLEQGEMSPSRRSAAAGLVERKVFDATGGAGGRIDPFRKAFPDFASTDDPPPSAST
jgi:hypothetical protein